MLEEQLSVITGLWDTPRGETFSFDGTHYQVIDSPALPKPVQQPHPPVIIGGAERDARPRWPRGSPRIQRAVLRADTAAAFGR